MDAHYYKDEFREMEEKLNKLKVKEIKNIAKVMCGPFGSSITVKDYTTEGVPLIRVSNIKEGKLSKKDVVYISEELAKKLKSYVVKEGDLIISQRGTLGLVVKVTKEFNNSLISANFIAIKEINNKEILPDFLKIVISSKLGRTQLMRKTSGQVQTKITTDDIKAVKVPILPKEIQDKIVQIMENAYKLKKQKEKEAEELLKSIDDYVLKELGIGIPEIEENKIFIVNFNDILKNKRLDAEFNQEKYKILMDAIENGKYKTVEVEKLFKYIKKGVEVGSSAYTKEGIPFIRVSDIDDYKIHFEDADKKISPELYKELKDKYKPQVGELLYSKDGTIGFCVMVEEDRDFIISGGILRLKVKDGINPYYIKAMLSTKLLKTLAEQRSIGAVIKHLRETEFKKLKIPLPPKEIQDKIAEEVKKRIKKAKQLKEESKKVIEDAKKEVEKILLGE